MSDESVAGRSPFGADTPRERPVSWFRRRVAYVLRLAAGAVDAPPPSGEHGLRQYVNGFSDPRYFSMGTGSYGTPVVHVYYGDKNSVRVGNYCSIGEDVEFMVGGNHTIDSVSSWPGLELLDLPGAWATMPWSRGDIVVGNDVWIGRGAKILSGVSIGNGAVVGAYAVVTTDVRPYAIVAGNPAVERRRRFADDVVSRLLDTRWWEWSFEDARANAALLESRDVEAFLRSFGR